MATPLINGVNYSWVNLVWSWYTVPLIGIKSITYKSELKKENNYGQGDKPTSRGYSNYTFTGEIEIYRDEWQKIINAAPNNDPLQIPWSNFTISFGGSRVTAQTDILVAAELNVDEFNAKQGDTALIIKVPIIFADLQHK